MYEEYNANGMGVSFNYYAMAIEKKKKKTCIRVGAISSCGNTTTTTNKQTVQTNKQTDRQDERFYLKVI